LPTTRSSISTKALGEIEIKPETLRYTVCVTRDLLEDASINLESWILGKVQRAFSITIGNAVARGNGNGMPTGLLNSGIGICETAAASPAGQLSWRTSSH
jgi:HK97 family phage major capsid protein